VGISADPNNPADRRSAGSRRWSTSCPRGGGRLRSGLGRSIPLYMRPEPPSATTAQARAATFGPVLVITAMVLSLPTVDAMHLPGGETPLLLAAFAAISSAAVAARRLPWQRWNRRWLLVWPLAVMGGVAAAGLTAPPGSTTTMAGLLTLAFFYIGITQPAGTGAALLPLGVACWIACYGEWTHPLLLRLPITLGVWAIVSESLSRLQSQVGRLTATLNNQASTDYLTGLGNRRTLNAQLDNLTPRDAIVFIDLDHFKSINDRYGHAVGDQVLADMGTTLRHIIRNQDFAYRFGGEELLLLLHQAGPIGAIAALQRIERRWQHIQPEVTFSAGISVLTEDTDPAAAIAAADQALYAAKAAGRHCWKLDNDQPIAANIG
jgi:diguanylate cyclase (GGDEF)-like protein